MRPTLFRCRTAETGDTFGTPQDFLEGLPSSPDHCRDRQGPSIGGPGMCMEKGEPIRREETSYAGYEGACLLLPPPPEVCECHGFRIFGYQYSTSQHHAVYWELKSKCSTSGYLSRREELRSPQDCSSTVIIPAQGTRYKGAGHLTCPSSRLAVFPVRSARYCCARLHARLQY